jgi:site-specific DNA-cytosine methylase
MGYPEGYSDTEKTEKQSINEHEGWWFEPDIPRITPRKDLRTKRLKCLGNSIVPQIMVEIGKAILEQEKKDAS